MGKIIVPCGKPSCHNAATKKFRASDEVIKIDKGLEIKPRIRFTCDEHFQEFTEHYPEYFLEESINPQSRQ